MSFRYSALFAIAFAVCAPVFAADLTPVGTWTTIDDSSGKPKSIVQITESNGTLEGKVVQVLDSDNGPHPLCDKCEGERKNQPVEGMVIIWGVSKDGDVWDGGSILDPHNGKTYKVKLSMAGNGQKLDVRGYIGFSLLGRTQQWVRRAAP
jgi:uncharacterized protein (DUF2147 family)